MLAVPVSAQGAPIAAAPRAAAGADTTPPGPVAGLTKSAVGSSKLTLTWVSPTTSDFAGVTIRRATGTTPPATATAGTAVASLAKPQASFTDTGLAPSTSYSYAVFARDAVPNYAAAAVVTVTTTAVPTYDSAVLADQPVRYYRLGEASGTKAADSSTANVSADYSSNALLGQTGSLAGSSNTALGRSTTAAAGITASASGLPKAAAARTVEFWEKGGDIASLSYAGFSVTSASTWAGNLQVSWDAGSSNRDRAAPANWNDGKWHLATVTYDGTTLRLYQDGQKYYELAATLNTSTSDGLAVTTSGGLDEVAVYPTALSDDRIAAHWTAGGSRRAECATTPTTRYATAVLADHPGVYYRAGDQTTDSSSRVAFDSSGGCANGALADTATAAAGALAGDSDGATNGSLTGTATKLPKGAAARTVEFWEKGTGTASLSYAGFSVTSASVWPGNLQVSWDSASSNRDRAAPMEWSDGKWHLATVTYDGTTLRLYQDGQKYYELAATLNTVSDDVLSVTTSGGLDDVAVYPTALSDARISAHWTAGGSQRAACAATPTAKYATAVLADHPGAYYRAGDQTTDSSSRVAFDSSGGCINGALADTATAAAGALAGDTDGAATISLASSATKLPRGAAARTVEFWEKGATTSLSYAGFSVTSASVWPGNLQVSWDSASSNRDRAAPMDWSDGQWHLAIVTYDGTTLRLYQDGQKYYELAATLNTVADGGLLATTSGSLDEVAVYPTALSDVRVAAHWTAGGSRRGPCVPAPTSKYSAAVLTDAPGLYYRAGDLSSDSSSRVAYDSSGNCQNGALGDTAAAVPGGGAIAGDGDGAATVSLAGPSAKLPTGAAPRTVEFWEKGSGSATLSYGWDRGFSVTSASTFDNNLQVSWDAGASNRDQQAATAWDDGKWHLATVTYDGTTLRLYQDGHMYYALAATLNTSADAGLRITTSGGLDEVAVYPTALSDARVAAHWAASGRTPPTGGALSARETGAGGNASEPCPLQPIHGCAADPVDTAFGSLMERVPGISLPGRGPALDWSSSYSSAGSATDGALGFGWTGSYQARLSVDAGTGDVTVTQENGAQVVFTHSGGTFTAAPRVRATLVKQADGSYVMVRQADQTLKFDATGKLTSIADRNGETTTLTYTGTQLTTVKDPAGRAFSLTWAGTHVTRVTDPAGRHVDYAYTTAGDLKTITAVDGGITTLGYDTAHRMTTMTDPVQTAAGAGGKSVVTQWDTSGRVIKQTDQLGRVTTFAYTGDNASAAGGTTLVTDPAGHQVLDTYSYGQRSSTTAGYGSSAATTTYYAYDPDTFGVTSVSVQGPNDTNNHSQAFTYNADGLPVTQMDGLGRQTDTTYNAFHEPLTITAPNPSSVGSTRVTTTYAYDGAGNLLTVTSPLYTSATVSTNRTTTYLRATTAHPGDVTGVSDPTGATTSYTYDAAGDLASNSTPSGRRATFTYDPAGRVSTSVAPRGNITGGTPANYTSTYTYDGAGRVLTLTVANGTTPVVTKHTYDLAGRVLTDTDPDSRVTTYAYDAAGQLLSTKRPDGTTTTNTYRADGMLAAQGDAAGHVTAYGEDALGRAVSLTDPLSRATTQTLDAAGAPLKVTDASGKVATNTYDNAGSLLSTSYSDGKTATVTRTYGRAGNPATMVDASGTTTYGYDSLSRVTSLTAPVGTLAYAYNLRGQVTSLTYPNAKAVARGYEPDGGLSSITDWLNGRTAFTYDADQELTGTLTPNGVTAASEFDPAGRISRQTYAKGTTSLGSITYARDAAGQVTTETPVSLGSTRTYAYNSLGQLTGDNSTTFAYDKADNPTALAGATQSFDAADQLGSSVNGGVTTSYTNSSPGDRTRATTGSASTTFAYDQNNRLTGYTAGSTTAAYVYDGHGLRASKTVNGVLSRMSYDTVTGDLPLILSDGSNSYVYGPDDVPIEQISTAGTPTYLGHDQLGSVRLVTNAAGASAGTATYSAYGKRTTTGTTTPFGFAGQYTDAESGLVWMRARTYDPGTGMFVSRDPLLAITRAPYDYADNDPVNSVDPSGLNPFVEAFKNPTKAVVKDLIHGVTDTQTLAEDAITSMFDSAVAIPVKLDTHIIEKTRDMLYCEGRQVAGAGTPGYVPELCMSAAGSGADGAVTNYFGGYRCDEFGNLYYERTGYVRNGVWHKGW